MTSQLKKAWPDPRCRFNYGFTVTLTFPLTPETVAVIVTVPDELTAATVA
jgi:hypothetical protein